MRYDVYMPCDRLKPYINSFAVQESAEERTFTVLPDTGLVIGFQFSGRLSHMSGAEEIPLAPSGVTGLHDSYRIFRSSPGIGTVLVYFSTTGAAAFFRQPLHELFRESLSLDNFMLRSGLLVLEEQLQAAQSDGQRIGIVESFLISRLRTVTPDPLVLAAIGIIYRHKGNIRMKELSLQLHTSQSPLEKRFRRAVGTTQKKFAGIVRMKHALQSYRPGSSLTELGYDAGFYDQAHFIKAFRAFTGSTPEAYFDEGFFNRL